MANISLSALRLKCRQRSDQENSQLISDSELDGLINDSIKELYDRLLLTYGDEYYSSSQDITLSSGTKNYSLPSDFYKLISASMVVQNREYPLKKMDFVEVSRSSSCNSGLIRLYYVPTFEDIVFPSINPWITATSYEQGNTVLEGGNTYLCLISHTSETFATDLAADRWRITTDIWDEFNGWGEYVVLDVAMKMMEKEETDNSQLLIRFNKMDERLKRIAKSRDLGQTHKIIDIRRDRLNYKAGYYIRAGEIIIVNADESLERYFV